MNSLLDDDNDFFGSADADLAEIATLNKVSRALENDGYRLGKEIEEANLLQAGFDAGFIGGSEFGQSVGSLYALLRYDSLHSSNPDSKAVVESLFGEIEAILFVEIPKLMKVIERNSLDTPARSTDESVVVTYKAMLDDIVRLTDSLSSSPDVAHARSNLVQSFCRLFGIEL